MLQSITSGVALQNTAIKKTMRLTILMAAVYTTFLYVNIFVYVYPQNVPNWLTLGTNGQFVLLEARTMAIKFTTFNNKTLTIENASNCNEYIFSFIHWHTFMKRTVRGGFSGFL
jgi:hypothetical protein